MRYLLKVDGTECPLNKPISLKECERLIGADCLDSVLLKDRIHVMLVDDTGMIDGKPVNPKATAFYHEKCGGRSPFCIHGDVVIAPDEDYA